jgi:aminoglycoside 6'-N-acetyltransferase I
MKKWGSSAAPFSPTASSARRRPCLSNTSTTRAAGRSCLSPPRKCGTFPAPASRAMLEGELVLGWIGGLPKYGGRVWGLHPLVVRREYRRRGIGRVLVAAFEAGAAARGAPALTLGTDDDSGMTSLASVDLFSDSPQRTAAIRDLDRDRPFLFYRKPGYTVTGVMPGANGPGRPGIFMSKRAPDNAGRPPAPHACCTLRARGASFTIEWQEWSAPPRPRVRWNNPRRMTRRPCGEVSKR